MVRIIRYYLVGAVASLSFSVQAEQDMMSLALNEFSLPEFNEYSVPVVLSATRLQQHQADVPASVTILDEHFIKQVGAQNIAELLRYVPGMMVAPDDNNNSDTVHYHGGAAVFAKNLQVLVNGRSMYRAGVAAVSWYEMPVALEDIKRIEVVRGPNAASYGANAFQAVINILTKHPADTYGSSVSLQGGNNGEENVYIKHGGRLGNSDYRVSFVQKRSDEFKSKQDTRQSRFVDVEHYYQDSKLGEFETSFVLSDADREVGEGVDYQINRDKVSEQRIEIGTRWTKDLSNKHQVQISVYGTKYDQSQRQEVAGVPVAFLDDNLRGLFASDEYFLNGDKTAVKAFEQQKEAAEEAENPLLLLGYYTSLSAEEKSQLGFINMYETGQAQVVNDFLTAYDTVRGRSINDINATNNFLNRYASINPESPVAGVINSDLDEYRYDIEIQDTYIYSPALTLVSGASFRRDEVRSQTYLNGFVKNDTSRLFASATWQATTKANLHLGIMAEQESDADLVFAPRAALNYKLTPSQAVRLVYSESVRSPDLFEQDAYWQLTVENPVSAVPLNGATFYQTQQAPGNLDHQYIRSYELGYYGRFNRINSELDVRIFEENLTDVFYQTIRLDRFETQEDITMKFQGVEWQYSIKPWSDTQLRWVGAYVDASTNVDRVEYFEREQVILRVYAKNTHTLSWLQSWGENTSSSVNYILANEYDDLNEIQDERTLFERLDMKIIHGFVLQSVNVELSLNVQHDLSSDPYIWSNSVYEDETRFQLGARFNF